MIPKIQQRSYSNLRAPYVSAKSYAIFSKGSLLHGKHASEVREIASLTKIMTCYVSLITIKKFKIDLDTLIPITYKASSITGTSAKLQSGDRVIL